MEDRPRMAYFYCRNATSCRAGALARVETNTDNPGDYFLVDMATEHTCDEDSKVRRFREKVVRLMHERIGNNPLDESLSDVQRSVREDVMKNMPEEERREFEGGVKSLTMRQMRKIRDAAVAARKEENPDPEYRRRVE